MRSSTISIGAASEPARSSSEVSLASAVVMLPEIWTRPPVIAERITGAVTTSDLPWSISTIAIRLPTLAAVSSPKIVPPEPSRLMLTAGDPISSKLGWASLMLSPVSSTCLLTKVGAGFSPALYNSSYPLGTLPPNAACTLAGSSSTMRTSKVAVRPMMSFALAVS